MSNGLFWIIGCGNMAGAMVRRWIETGLDASQVRVVDPALPDLPGGLSVLPAIPADTAPAAKILLAVKPQLWREAGAAIADLLADDAIIVSIIAGPSIDGSSAASSRPAASAEIGRAHV